MLLKDWIRGESGRGTDLANRLNLSRETVSRIANGHIQPPSGMVAAISELTGGWVTPADLQAAFNPKPKVAKPKRVKPSPTRAAVDLPANDAAPAQRVAEITFINIKFG